MGQPDWVPQVAPDFCPTCGVYWECECGVVDQEEARTKFIPELPPSSLGGELMRRFTEENAHPGFAPPTALEASIRESENQGWNERNPGTHFTFNKLDSLGLARAADAP